MISLHGVGKCFGDVPLFENLDFQLPAASVICFLGPSGCGKTTLLKMMAGLLQPDTGKVAVQGRISFVFQEARLLPWADVRENASYAMDPHLHKRELRERTDAMLDLLELKDAATLLPGQISGGMAGRTALARALLAPFDILLLDEPLSSLDPDLRNRIIEFLPGIIEGKSVVLVSHDYRTAAALSDSVYLLSPSDIVSVDKNDIEKTLQRIESAKRENSASR